MRKEDNISIFLSIIINVIIILLIPSMSAKHIQNKKIKIGLVSYDNNDKTRIEGEKNTNSPEKNIAPKVERPKQPPKPKEEKKKQEPKKDPNKVDLAALDSIAKKIIAPKVDVLAVATKSEKKVSNLELPKKKLEQIEKISEPKNLSKDIVLEKDPLPTKAEDLKFNNDTIKFNSEIGKDKEFDRILHSEDGKEGLPSGYKLGTEDGDIVARWDNSNSEPIYPESAQAKGLHGTVKIRMNIDEYGNVKSLKLEKGSGVPEINNAIEKVGRTWKIYLSKNGLNVQGDVILEYNFILK